MMRNLDVIWQTMRRCRGLLLGGVTCSEGHLREIGLAICGGWNQGETGCINQEFKYHFEQETTELRDGI